MAGKKATAAQRDWVANLLQLSGESEEQGSNEAESAEELYRTAQASAEAMYGLGGETPLADDRTPEEEYTASIELQGGVELNFDGGALNPNDSLDAEALYRNAQAGGEAVADSANDAAETYAAAIPGLRLNPHESPSAENLYRNAQVGDEAVADSADDPAMAYANAIPGLRLNPEDAPTPAKHHPDPRAADPEFAALLDERGQIQQQIEAAIRNDAALQDAQKGVAQIAERMEQLSASGGDPKEIARLESGLNQLVERATAENKPLQKLSAQLEGVERKLEAAQRRLNKTGVSPQALGAEYKDEDKKMGWQAEPIKNPALRALLKEGAHVRTKYFNARERDESELSIGADGKVRSADGALQRNATGGSSAEAVVNPETGKLHQFNMDPKKINERAKHPVSGRDVQVTERVHHSSPLAGKEVAGAGAYTTDDEGRLTSLSNKSGHYKPGVDKLIQSVEALMKQGAFLNKDWVNTWKLQGKERELFGRVTRAMTNASELQVELRQKTLAMTRTLDEDPNADVDAIEAEIKARSAEITELLENIEKGKRVLAKVGVSQSNKVTGDVEYFEPKKGMTGVQVHAAKTKKQGVDEFLSTGGGNAHQANLKDFAQDELLEKTEAQREQLDRDAEGRATQGSDAKPEAVDAALRGFDARAQNRPSGSGQSPAADTAGASGSAVSSYGDLGAEIHGGESEGETDDAANQYEDLGLASEEDESDDEEN